MRANNHAHEQIASDRNGMTATKYSRLRVRTRLAPVHEKTRLIIRGFLDEFGIAGARKPTVFGVYLDSGLVRNLKKSSGSEYGPDQT